MSSEKTGFTTSGGDVIISMPTPPGEERRESAYLRPSTDGRAKKQYIVASEINKETAADINLDTPSIRDHDDLDGQHQRTTAERLKPLLFRLFMLIVPSILLSVPIIVGWTQPQARGEYLFGTRVRWFFTWILVFWASPWVCSIIARYCLPVIVRFLIGVFSKKAKKYYAIAAKLEIPLVLVGWSFACMISWDPIMNGHHARHTKVDWKPWVQKTLSGLFACSLIYFGKSVLLQIVYVRYRQAQLAGKVVKNKQALDLLARLYQKSRVIYPESTSGRFAREDDLLDDANTYTLTTFADKATESSDAYSLYEANTRVIHAMDHIKEVTPALTRRIWGAFVTGDKKTLVPSDLQQYFEDRPEVVTLCFEILDKDGNGDITFEEMKSSIVGIARERRDLYSGWTNSKDILKSFSILLNCFVAALGFIVLLGFLTQIGKAYGYLTGLMSAIGFAVNGTITEMFSAIIFIFVKHPFDVGDFVGLDDGEYVVEHISLLYTQVRSTSVGKYTHFPNSVLNSKKVENLSRSGSMQEVFSLVVNYNTTSEQVDALRTDLAKFIAANSRDYCTGEDNLEVELVGVGLDKLELKISLKYKGNWADPKRMHRKAKALAEILSVTKEVSILKA